MQSSTVGKLIGKKLGEEAIEASLKKWREGGQGIFGFLCTYVPEEILLAAGLSPRRILGRTDNIAASDGYIYVNTCPFVKNIMAGALENKYDIDGVVFTKQCDAIIRLHELWAHFLPTPFNHIIDLPRQLDSYADTYFEAEIRDFKNKLETFIGRQITDDSLQKAIDTYNKTRKLLRSLYDLRKKDNPPLTGKENLIIMNAAMAMPKPVFNPILEEILEELGHSNGNSDYMARVILTGGEVDRAYLAEAVEDNGALVVAEDMCMGFRYFGFDDDVQTDSEPIKALTKRYLHRMPCSTMHPGLMQRVDNLARLVKEFKADGVIFHSLKFCDPYVWDYPVFEKELRARSIPVTHVETDYSQGSVGQIKTRIGAFIEMIGIGG